MAAAVVVVMAVLAGAALTAGRSTGSGGWGRARVERETPITAMDQGLDLANNSPALVADPTDARFVVLANRLDAPDFGCALQVSGSAGHTWQPASPVAALPAGVDKCYAPEVAFDSSGLLYYLFVGLAGGGNEPVGAFLTTSADRARTFAAPRQVLGPRNFGVRLAIDPDVGPRGRIHLVWLHATSDPTLGGFGPPPNPILAAHSDDGGQTFSAPVPVSEPSRARVVAPALALGSDHVVHVAYVDLGADARDYQGLEGDVWDGRWSVVLASSTNGGKDFAETSVVDDEVLPFERIMLVFTMPPPALAVAGGRVCVGWADARRGDADVFARCSMDRGRAWEDLRRLNDDPVGTGARQYLPHLAFAPGGRLDAVFYDRRDTGENLATSVYYTSSGDHGRNYAPNLRLTSEVTDPRIGQEYIGAAAQGLVEFGSRLGLLANSDTAVAAWADTRNSKPFSTGQDLFGAVVRIPRSGPPWWSRAVGILLLIGGAVAFASLTRRTRPLRRRGREL